jgi:hypothetical protein
MKIPMNSLHSFRSSKKSGRVSVNIFLSLWVSPTRIFKEKMEMI